MSEQKEISNENRSNSVEDQKEVEFYSAGLNAWINTRFEADKSILSLSAGGVGLLATFITTSDNIKSECSLFLYALSLVFFVIVIALILKIFRLNADYLEMAIKDKNDDQDKKNRIEKQLERLDLVSYYMFGFAVLFSSFFGFSLVLNSYKINNNYMGEKNPKKTVSGMAFDSLSGLSKFNPKSKSQLNESLSGFDNMRPNVSNVSNKDGDGNVTQQKTSTSKPEGSGNSSVKGE